MIAHSSPVQALTVHLDQYRTNGASLSRGRPLGWGATSGTRPASHRVAVQLGQRPRGAPMLVRRSPGAVRRRAPTAHDRYDFDESANRTTGRALLVRMPASAKPSRRNTDSGPWKSSAADAVRTVVSIG